MVTAELPPMAKPGQRLDVTVSAIGQAKSLRGGTLIMMPLLTFVAMLMGIFGGMMVVWWDLGFSPGYFISRMYDTTAIGHFWAGIAKAPVFAIVIAVIGCRQGLNVGGSVESLGKRTTASVVQSIFAVVVIDAIFALLYLEMGV